MTGPAQESRSRTAGSRRPSGQPRHRSSWGFGDIRPAVQWASTQRAGPQGLSRYTYLPKSDLGDPLEGAPEAPAWRTEPLFLFYVDQALLSRKIVAASHPSVAFWRTAIQPRHQRWPKAWTPNTTFRAPRPIVRRSLHQERLQSPKGECESCR